MDINIPSCGTDHLVVGNPNKIKSWVSPPCKMVTEWLVLLPAPWNMELWLLKLFLIKCNSLCIFRYQKLLTGKSEVKWSSSIILSCFCSDEVRWVPQQTTGTAVSSAGSDDVLLSSHPSFQGREHRAESDELWMLGTGWSRGSPGHGAHQSSTEKCSGICRQSTSAQRVDGSGESPLSGRAQRV